MYLLKEDIEKSIKDSTLVIRPLLDISQLGEITVDFRLGYDFLVSVQGREAFIDASFNEENKGRSIGGFFQETRRRVGDTFLLHPNQTVLTTSLEYLKLPNNVFAILNMRSSYTRLGITISTIVQPGYCGCISLELTNNNKNPIKLTIGARIFQARFVKLEGESNYFHQPRKYVCHVRPEISAVCQDKDLEILYRIKKDM